MKIVVIGGSGLIGRKLVPILLGRGHEAVSASPSSGVDAVSGGDRADRQVPEGSDLERYQPGTPAS